MMLTLQDRLRVLWRGGAKKVSLDAVVPIILLPVMLFVASINIYCSITICLAMPVFLGYTYKYKKKISPRTKFFFLWSFWSVVYLWILFEATVPLLELLPEENIILIVLLSSSLFYFYKTKQQSVLNHIVQNTVDVTSDSTELKKTAIVINEDDSEKCQINQTNICSICRKHVPTRTFHCKICQSCIAKRDHHNIWLDCCIGESNSRSFFLACIIGFCALTFGSNLSLTSICHPFLIANIYGVYIFLPDDCSEVFDQFDVALCFVGSIYALLMAACIFLMVVQQFYFISKGVTGTEWRRGHTNNKRSCVWNWKSFLCCHR